MADDKKLELAQQVYQTLCDSLDHCNLKYGKEEEKLLVHFGMNGEDIPLHFIIFVDVDKQLVTALSPLPFKMSEAKRMEGAIAACAATYGMVDGSFDYNLETGSITFRLTVAFMDSKLGEGVFKYMIGCSGAMAEKYNDMFFALDKGVIGLEDFLAKA
ncbi:MAG: hypothetical protein E7448_08760 [Ruminococcaceae bacterium]|nr:hypothetical protein [Oscillospiraceae bacterium]